MVVVVVLSAQPFPVYNDGIPSFTDSVVGNKDSVVLVVITLV